MERNGEELSPDSCPASLRFSFLLFVSPRPHIKLNFNTSKVAYWSRSSPLVLVVGQSQIGKKMIYINRQSHWKVTKLQSNFKLNLDKLDRALNNRASSLVKRTCNLSISKTPLCNRPGETRPVVGYFSLPGGILSSLVNFIPPWCRILVSLVRPAPLQENVTSLEFRSCFCS